MSRRRGAVLASCAVALAARLAGADSPPTTTTAPPKIVALVTGSGHHAIAIGERGETYERDETGDFVRRRRGGVAGAVIAAAQASGGAFVATAAGGLFHASADGWDALRAAPNQRAVLGRGVRALAAIGNAIIGLDGARAKIATTPGAVTALGAGATGIVAMTANGALALDHSAWKPLANIPADATPLSDRWFAVAHGLELLASGGAVVEVAWPHDLTIGPVVVRGDRVLAAAVGPTAIELLTVTATTLTREPVPLDAASVIAAIALDGDTPIIATRDGRFAVRTGRGWTVFSARDELPAERSGPPPAHAP